MSNRIGIFLVLLSAACSSANTDPGPEPDPLAPSGDTLSGCQGKASSAIPANGTYVLTTFGGPDEPQPLACGGHSKSGSWYYAASKQRYGCGKRVRITANGKCVVAQTDDYGPDVCVEKAAGMPVMDASPLVGKALFGQSALGWKDAKKVKVELVSTSTPLGICTGGSGGSGGSGGTGGTSAGGTSAGGTSAGGTSAGGASSGGTSAGGTSSGGVGGASASCVGHCGTKAPSGCWCDSGCTGYGDCCADKASACGTSGSGGTSSGGTSGGGTGGGGTACAGDGDCNPGNDGSGLICSGGVCVPGCHTNAQCPGIKTCKSGQCA
jgi:hypothetical protein